MRKWLIIIVIILILIFLGVIFYLGLKQTRVELPAQVVGQPTPEPPLIPVVTNLKEATLDEKKTYQIELAQKAVELPPTLNLLDVAARPYKKDQLLIIEKPSGFLETNAWVYHQKNGVSIPLFQGIIGLSLNWSTDGEQMLKFQIEPETRRPNLTLINQSDNLELELPWVTFPEKCLIEKEALYCAVPLELPANLRWPDDYWKRRFYPQDRLVKLVIKNSSIETLDDGLSQLIDAVDLKLIKNELYFTNRRNGKVYKINI